ncbi:MAG: DUF4129 domain-containing protein [Mediterranea sp.]|jgi:hypothetical protein|nr:DUF4129 domain-containing protein [Mediterranea sp.]
MLPATLTDTLTRDTTLIATWQSDASYDYNRELMAPRLNIFEWLSRTFFDTLRSLFGSRFADEYGYGIMLCVGIVIFALIAWFVYKKNPGMFMRDRKRGLDYSVDEDTIYGVDFGKAIAEALKRQNFREATRLLYLQTLKQLSDGNHIDWQPYKTPTEYLREVRHPDFRALTNHFLRVRYGNFEATEELFHAMTAAQRELNTALREATGKGGTA